VRVIKGVEASLNNEAVRVISEMPRWNAGQVNGEAVPVHCLLPIPFRL
jgi:protein TonB